MDPRKSTPVPPCPYCQHPEGAWLPDTSAACGANCFYCPACLKIWQAEELESVQIATTAPDADLSVYCVSCDTLLTLIHFTIGGVVPVAQWDRYVCHRCGMAFEYRRSTSQLKRSA